MEKPAPAEAARLHARGALWNTLVLAARARTLWEIACERLPNLIPFFAVLQSAIGTRHEREVLDEAYETMPRVNFSSALLERAADRIAVQSLDGVMWNDWGQPVRIVESLLAIGRRPAFSLRLLGDELAARGDSRPLADGRGRRRAGSRGELTTAGTANRERAPCRRASPAPRFPREPFDRRPPLTIPPPVRDDPDSLPATLTRYAA